jgi:hypothetical protein
MRTRQRLTPLVRALLAAAVLACALAAAPAAIGKPSSPPAHTANAYLVGIGDERAEMFGNPLWQQLHTRIARYIAPYDAAEHADSLANARAWITAAEEQHVQVLVAFYHSEHTPTVLPGIAQYKHAVQKFVKLFPHVKQYQSWDEANRHSEPGQYSSPSPVAAAEYYQALLRVCKGCTVIGLDVLDQNNIGPTLTYISEFKREIGHLETVMPRIWGLHDYSDVNRLESWRTREIARALPGQIWLTETGGIVQFGGAFPNIHGSGLARASRVIRYTLAVASVIPQIKRLYLYDWTGGNSRTRFDAGLTDNHFHPRPGYVELCRLLHASKCGVKASSH